MTFETYRPTPRNRLLLQIYVVECTNNTLTYNTRLNEGGFLYTSLGFGGMDTYTGISLYPKLTLLVHFYSSVT